MGSLRLPDSMKLVFQDFEVLKSGGFVDSDQMIETLLELIAGRVDPNCGFLERVELRI